MRHRKHASKLNRTSEHRAALLRNLAIALVRHERIHTTKVKAVQLRPFLEPLVTRAKRDSLTARRYVLSALGDRASVRKLFEQIGPRVAARDGGYLRIVADRPRMGDGALMAYIEFVDAKPVSEAKPEPKTDLKKRLKQKRHEMRKERAELRK
jgi:large subunit ribosomal protein L17